MQNNTLTELDTDRTYYKDTRPFDAETLDSLTEVYERGSGVNTQLIVRYPIGVHDLYLIEVLPNGPLQRQIPYLSASLIFSLAAILALGSALAFLLHRMIARPITALQSRIEAAIFPLTRPLSGTTSWATSAAASIKCRATSPP